MHAFKNAWLRGEMGHSPEPDRRRQPTLCTLTGGGRLRSQAGCALQRCTGEGTGRRCIRGEDDRRGAREECEEHFGKGAVDWDVTMVNAPETQLLRNYRPSPTRCATRPNGV